MAPGASSVFRERPDSRHQRRLWVRRIWFSSVCITSRMGVRAAQLGIHRDLTKARGCRMAWPRNLKARGIRPPPPGEQGHQQTHGVRALVVADYLDVGGLVRIDPRGDGQLVRVVGPTVPGGHGQQGLGVGPHKVSQPVRQPGQQPLGLALQQEPHRAQDPAAENHVPGGQAFSGVGQASGFPDLDPVALLERDHPPGLRSRP